MRCAHRSGLNRSAALLDDATRDFVHHLLEE
jgi:hypothetical protein